MYLATFALCTPISIKQKVNPKAINSVYIKCKVETTVTHVQSHHVHTVVLHICMLSTLGYSVQCGSKQITNWPTYYR